MSNASLGKDQSGSWGKPTHITKSFCVDSLGLSWSNFSRSVFVLPGSVCHPLPTRLTLPFACLPLSCIRASPVYLILLPTCRTFLYYIYKFSYLAYLPNPLTICLHSAPFPSLGLSYPAYLFHLLYLTLSYYRYLSYSIHLILPAHLPTQYLRITSYLY